MLELVFYFYSFLLVASAIMVISLKNPVHSVLFLMLAFFNAAALFILLGAEFIAMILIIVYVGAVAVLFLFVVMMLNINIAQIKPALVKNLPLSLIIGIIIFVQMYIALNNSAKFLPKPIINEPINTTTNTEQLGKILYTDYFIVFQLAGIVLLVAMIGAIVLTLTHGKDAKRQNIAKQVMRTRQESVELVDVEIGKGVKI